MKKYELTDETCEFNGVVLHRIRALRNFNNVHEGDLGDLFSMMGISLMTETVGYIVTVKCMGVLS